MSTGSHFANSMRKEWNYAPPATEILFVFDTVSAKRGSALTQADGRRSATLGMSGGGFPGCGRNKEVRPATRRIYPDGVPNVLVVSAHPDDETFFAGGTMAKLRSQGAGVSVVCGTRGERGSTADLCSIEDLPQLREQELRTALEALHVNDLEFLPYEDKKLEKAPVDEMRRHLVKAVRRVKPEVVITFDPHGGNQHIDHVAISRFVSDALPMAADARCFPDTGAAHQVRRLLWQSPVPLFELPAGADLRLQPGFDFLIDIREWAAQKTEAMRAHRTQIRPLSRIYFNNPHLERLQSVEAFRIGWGDRPSVTPAADLFA